MPSKPTNWSDWDPVLNTYGLPHARADDEHLLEVFVDLNERAEALGRLINDLEQLVAAKIKAQEGIIRDVAVRITPGAKEAGMRGRRRKLSYNALLGVLGRATERRNLAEAKLDQAQSERSALVADLNEFCLEIVRRFMPPHLNVDIIDVGGHRFVISNKDGEAEAITIG